MNHMAIHNALAALAKSRFDSAGELRHIELGGYSICINNGFQITTPNGAVRHFKQYEAFQFLVKKIGE